MTEYEKQYIADCENVEHALDVAIAAPSGQAQETVLAAMRYSLLCGGKRIRAVLALEVCAMLGGEREDAMPAACALEMVHAYSLIHDDLPAMDNDDMRRGRPSCHVAYGEAMAILAGDGLQTCAFELLSGRDTVARLGAERTIQLVSAISHGIGEYGMLGGQCIDVEKEGTRLMPKEHKAMVSMKTGALIRASVLCGAICAGADAKTTAILSRFGEIVGEAFQITDDILDVIGDAETLGKPIGSDAAEQKNTYVTIHGLDSAREMEQQLYRDATAVIAQYGNAAGFLQTLLKKLSVRNR